MWAKDRRKSRPYPSLSKLMISFLYFRVAQASSIGGRGEIPGRGDPGRSQRATTQWRPRYPDPEPPGRRRIRASDRRIPLRRPSPSRRSGRSRLTDTEAWPGSGVSLPGPRPFFPRPERITASPRPSSAPFPVFSRPEPTGLPPSGPIRVLGPLPDPARETIRRARSPLRVLLIGPARPEVASPPPWPKTKLRIGTGGSVLMAGSKSLPNPMAAIAYKGYDPRTE